MNLAAKAEGPASGQGEVHPLLRLSCLTSAKATMLPASLWSWGHCLERVQHGGGCELLQ